jgi:hypothetical protein
VFAAAVGSSGVRLGCFERGATVYLKRWNTFLCNRVEELPLGVAVSTGLCVGAKPILRALDGADRFQYLVDFSLQLLFERIGGGLRRINTK